MSTLSQAKLKQLERKLLAKQHKKHIWVWRKDKQNLVEHARNFFPNFNQDELYFLLGEDCIDVKAQEKQDEEDWEEAFIELVEEEDLDEAQEEQFRNFLLNINQ